MGLLHHPPPPPQPPPGFEQLLVLIVHEAVQLSAHWLYQNDEQLWLFMFVPSHCSFHSSVLFPHIGQRASIHSLYVVPRNGESHATGHERNIGSKDVMAHGIQEGSDIGGNHCCARRLLKIGNALEVLHR